jgi:hypothetical protein
MANMLVDEQSGNFFVENINLAMPGVHKIDRRFIELNKILADSKDNAARDGGTDSTLVEDLKNSFSSRILYNDFLPIVEIMAIPKKWDDGEMKHYQLVDGYNRINALRELGYTHYWFDVVEFDVKSYNLYRTTLALGSNAHAPSKSSNDKDIFNAVVLLVNGGDLKKDFDVIKNYIKKTCKVRSDRAHKLADKVATHVGAPSRFISWTPAMVKNDVAGLNIYSHGNLDPVRNKYGWTTLEGYEPDTIMNAIAAFAKDGTESYIVGHVKTPDSKNNLIRKRMNMVTTLEDKKAAIIRVIEYYNKTGRLPFELIGFLPQDIDESSNEMIPV